MSKQEYTSKEIVSLIQEYFKCTPEQMIRLGRSGQQEWFCATEVKNASGFDFNRSLDVVLMNAFPSKGLVFHGIEVKVSKSDLMKELANPAKHEAFYNHLDFFSIACPHEIIDLDVIPKKWGVFCPSSKNGKLRKVREALPLHDETSKTIDRAFVVSFLRSISLRGAEKDDLDKLMQERFDAGYKLAKENFSQQWVQRQGREAIETLKRFEELTGVSLSSYDIETRAPVIKAIFENDPQYLKYTVEKAIQQFNKSVDSLELAIDALNGISEH